MLSWLVACAKEVVSLNVRWLILQDGQTGLSFGLLSVFHVLLGLTLWSLLATTSRGPGAVGEVLVLREERDVERGSPYKASDEAPLMEAGGQYERRYRPRRRRRSNINSVHKIESSSEEDEQYPEEHEMRTSSSEESEEEDYESGEELAASKKVEIVYASRMKHGASALMAKSNGKARFCRKVRHS